MVYGFEVHHQPLFFSDDGDDCDRGADYSPNYFHYLSMQFPKDYYDEIVCLNGVLLVVFDDCGLLVVDTNYCSDYFDGDLIFDVLRK